MRLTMLLMLAGCSPTVEGFAARYADAACAKAEECGSVGGDCTAEHFEEVFADCSDWTQAEADACIAAIPDSCDTPAECDFAAWGCSE